MSHSLCFSRNGVGTMRSTCLTHSHHHVEQHDPCTQIEDSAADNTHRVVRMHGGYGLHKGIGQRAIFVIITPHQTLHDAGHPHRHDVDYSTDRRHPEVHIHQTVGIHFGMPQLLHHMVNRSHRNHRYPAQRTGVHVTDGPVGVV